MTCLSTGQGASLATKALHKKRPALIPVLDNQAIFGAYMNPRWPGKPASTDTVKDVPRIKEALDWIAHDLTRPENEAAWSHLQAIEAGRSRIELFDMIWWTYFRQVEPYGQPDNSLRLPKVSRPQSIQAIDFPLWCRETAALRVDWLAWLASWPLVAWLGGAADYWRMEPPRGSPGWLEAFTAAERPDLWERERQEGLLDRVWPEYNHHGNDSPATFRALVPRYGDFQVLFTDRRADRIVARGRTIPFRWDGTLAGLPEGIDALGLRALGEDGPPTALSALAAEVDDARQGSGLSRLVIAAMAALARAHGLRSLLAPVRPNWKDRYPLIPIDRYAAWTRPDGLPFDPWMRVHARLGARILRPAPRSLHIAAPVGDWQAWTGMAFPEDGQYVFPHGLAPLTVSGGEGDYWEPNVWMSHDPMRLA